MEWIDSSKRARTIVPLIITAFGLFLVVNVALYMWNPATWGPSLLRSLVLFGVWALVMSVAELSKFPTAVGLDGTTLRIRYLMREKRIALGDIVAADLAPGGPDRSILRLAHRRTRTIALYLEAAAADGLASRLEGRGLFVNRTPPPVTHPPPPT